MEYGGRGLPPEYQTVFNEESAAYTWSLTYSAVTVGICAATLLSNLQQLPGRLEEYVDGGVVLSGLLITRGERSRLLVCFVGLPSLYQR